MRLLSAAAVVLYATSASAFCYPPSFNESMPDAPGSFTKPDVPFCLSEYRWNGYHTCDDWELNSYFDEVDDYIRDLESYYADVATFANVALAHADEALAYARCEANEVSSQHE